MNRPPARTFVIVKPRSPRSHGRIPVATLPQRAAYRGGGGTATLIAAAILLAGCGTKSVRPRVAEDASHRLSPPSTSASLQPCTPSVRALLPLASRMENSTDTQIVLCQALGPAAPQAIKGLDCAACGPLGVAGGTRNATHNNGPVGALLGMPNGAEPTWEQSRFIAWQQFAQGEYVGHARLPHVPEYRVRVDDLLEFVYRITRNETSQPYQLNVGDEIRVESVTDEKLNRERVIIQSDGTITMPLLGQVKATRRTATELAKQLVELYSEYYREPDITVTPLKVNTKLEDLRAAVDARAGVGGQTRQARVTPEGTIQLPAIGSVPVQGMTLEELQHEVNERYRVEVEGFEVTPVLLQRAPRFVFVVGEVRRPGRFTLEGPTTVMQAIALAEGWTVGANLRQVVVFRRADDWRLMATMLDLRGPLYANRPCPADEIWLNDSDIVVIPKSYIQVLDEWIELVFTRGIYGVVPFQGINVNFAKLGTL